MVAGDINNPRSPLRAFHHAPDDVVVRRRPVEALFQAPAVDDVAHEIHRVAAGMVEEIDQHLVVAAPSAEMDVADPDRAVADAVAPFGADQSSDRCRLVHRHIPEPFASEPPYRGNL